MQKELQIPRKPDNVLVPASIAGFELTKWLPLRPFTDAFSKIVIATRRKQMAQLLLIDTDKDHSRALINVLERHKHSVILSPSRRMVPRLLQTMHDKLDIVILYLSPNLDEDLRILSEITKSHGVNRPAILCVARTYQGPRPQLEIERQGGRLVYEQRN